MGYERSDGQPDHYLTNIAAGKQLAALVSYRGLEPELHSVMEDCGYKFPHKTYTSSTTDRGRSSLKKSSKSGLKGADDLLREWPEECSDSRS